MADQAMRIQLSRRKGWKMPPNTVKVDRASVFGNPYRVSPATDVKTGTVEWWLESSSEVWRFETKKEAQAAAVLAVKTRATEHFWSRVRVGFAGKNLACWCKLCVRRHAAGKPFDEACPDCEPCHSDLLGCAANGLSCDSPAPSEGRK